jgi:hypothetical protein
MVEMVMSGEAEIGVAEFVMSKDRSEVVAFTRRIGSIR